MTATLTLRDLNRALLARQMLLARERVKPLDAMTRLCGLQAQWPKPPFVGLWTRIENFRREDLARLFQNREAVRATMMRGTIHVVSAKDYLAFRPLFQPMLTRAVTLTLRERMKGLDLDAIAKAARRFLAKDASTFEATRDELARIFPKLDVRAMGFAARLLIPLVMVPDGRSIKSKSKSESKSKPPNSNAAESHWSFPSDARFSLADQWLDKSIRTDPDENDREALVVRYLAAFGPATPIDMQTWAGLKGLSKTFDTMREKLVVMRDEKKRELFDLPKAPRPSGDIDARPRFLPEFDNTLLAYADRARIVPPERKDDVFMSGLRVANTFLVDGFTAGTWKATRAKSKATIALTSFSPIAKMKKSDKTTLLEEAESLIRFLEPDATTFEVAQTTK